MEDSDAGKVFDEYGFVVEREGEGGDLDDTERCHVYSPQPGAAVAQSWKEVCENWKQYEKDSPKKVRQLLRKGVPMEMRSRVWQLFLNSNALRAQSSFKCKEQLKGIYTKLVSHGITDLSSEENIRTLNLILDKQLLLQEEGGAEGEGRGGEREGSEGKEGEGRGGERGSSEGKEGEECDLDWVRTTRQIMLDIVRTHSDHLLFIGDTPTKRSLFRILTLYVEYNHTVGYCQGMAYVAALLLMYMSEEDGFWALVSLLERPKYLSGYYDPSLSKIRTHAEVFGLLLKDKMPELAAHLDDLGVHPLMYVTSWFMCLFTILPCWDTVLSLCDLLFLEGVNTIFRAALAIMKVSSPELLAMHRLEKVLPFLQHLPSRLVSHKHLSRVLWQTTVHRWEFGLYLDVVFGRGGEEGKGKGPRGQKRRAGAEEQTPRPAVKRRKAAEDEKSGETPSFMSRVASVFTPAKSLLSWVGPLTPSLAADQTSTGNTRASVGGKRGQTGISGFKAPSTAGQTRSTSRKRKLEASEASAGGSNVIEMQEFSTAYRDLLIASPFSVHGGDFIDSAIDPLSGTQSARSGVRSVCGTNVDSLCTPLRRSPRLAVRKSRQHQRSSQFPTLSILSPLSERPLQQSLRTTSQPQDHHAFKTFSTPTQLRDSQRPVKRQRGSPGSPGSSPELTNSPEVELRPIKRRRRLKEGSGRPAPPSPLVTEEINDS